MRNAKIRESLGLLRKCGLKVSGIVDVGIQHSTPPCLVRSLAERVLTMRPDMRALTGRPRALVSRP